MSTFCASAVACPNIALIKYWGNRDDALRLPANSSLSMNLAGLTTCTRVSFDPANKADRLTINGARITGEGLQRVSHFLDLVRSSARISSPAQVESHNSFPSGAGIASSASAFAALALAASTAAGLNLDEPGLSRLARRGSGSACRSIPTGFVEWVAGSGDFDSYAHSFAPPDAWDLVDCIAIVQAGTKAVGSSRGHPLAKTSPLQAVRVQGADQRIAACKQAILAKDFEAFSQVVELDSYLMHAVMMTSSPSLLYWAPATVSVLLHVQEWRRSGLAVCATIDAGPNVHVLTLSNLTDEVIQRLGRIPGVSQVLRAAPGGPAQLESGDRI